MELNLFQAIAVYALPVIFAITLHEAAHGYVARHFGDMTAYAAGRISLNPIRHVDPLGTLLIPAITLSAGGILFGWAKPVPVNFGNLKNPKRDMRWVALAGPAANLLMAVAWALIHKVVLALPFTGSAFLLATSAVGVRLNLLFMALNLLPLLPLDGGRVVASLLPGRVAYQYEKMEPFGIYILLALILIEAYLKFPVLSLLMYPFLAAGQGVVNLLT
jgi:Zn-dependent protease